MQKIQNWLPQGMLLSFVIKMLVVSSPTVSDMGIVFALVSICGVQDYLQKRRSVEEFVNATTKKLEEQNTIINKQNEVLQVFAVEHAKMKQVLEGVKLKNDFQNPLAKKVG